VRRMVVLGAARGWVASTKGLNKSGSKRNTLAPCSWTPARSRQCKHAADRSTASPHPRSTAAVRLAAAGTRSGG
jgi:hypothetical protein